jgi:hypothetical protein
MTTAAGSRAQLVCGSANGETHTKLKDEEHQKIDKYYSIPLHENAPLEQGAWWWAD